MNWLANNWIIVVAGLAFLAFHFLGHRGHGGHGGHGGGGHGRHGGHGQAPSATPPETETATEQGTLPQNGAPVATTAADPAPADEPPKKPHSHGGGHC